MNQAEKFFAWEMLRRLAEAEARITFARDVRRGPWTIPKDSTGRLLPPCHDSDGMIFAAVRLDNPPEDLLAEYDGEIHWVEDLTLHDIEDDLSFSLDVIE